MRACICVVALWASIVMAAPEGDNPGVSTNTLPDVLQAVPSTTNQDAASRCQRHPLNVSFADIGWEEWVVAPPQYDAGYCAGSCPYPLMTPYAQILARDSKVKPGTMKQCCVPTAYEPASLIILNSDKVPVKYDVQDMKVKSCGCPLE